MSRVHGRRLARAIAALLASCLALSPAAPTLGASSLVGTAMAATAALGLPVPTSRWVSRAQAVEAVAAVAGLLLQPSARATYTDVPPTSGGFGAIEAAVKAGLMNGWAPASGSFDPGAPISRIELAVLATDALGLQEKAQAVTWSPSLYPRLRDLSSTDYDLGYAVAMLSDGVVPPESATSYGPRTPVTPTMLAVALYRMWKLDDVPASASLSLTASSVLTGKADALQLTVLNRLGTPVPTANLARYGPTYAVQSPGRVSAGVFSASQSGSYVITASLSGPLLTPTLEADAAVSVVAPKPVIAVATTASADYAVDNTTGVTFTATANGWRLPNAAVLITAVGRDSDTGTFDVSATDGGSASPSLTLTTDADGQVTVFLTDTVVGDQGTVSASTESASATTGTVTLTSAAVTSGTVSAAPSTVTAGPGDVELQVAALDPAGRPVPGLATSDFAVASSDPDAGTSGRLPVTAETYGAGVYTLTATDTDADEAGGSPQPQTLTVSVDGTGLASQPVVTVDPGPAALVTGVTDPTSATAGQSATATITATDAYGNAVAGNVTVGTGAGELDIGGLSPSPSGVSPTYPTSVTFADGSATLAVVPVDAGGQSLTAAVVPSSGSPTIVTAADPVVVAAGPAVSAAVVSGTYSDSNAPPDAGNLTPGSLASTGAATASQAVADLPGGYPPLQVNLTMQAVDAFGNAVTTAGDSISVAFTAGTYGNAGGPYVSDGNSMLSATAATTGDGGQFSVTLSVDHAAALDAGTADSLALTTSANALVTTVSLSGSDVTDVSANDATTVAGAATQDAIEYINFSGTSTGSSFTVTVDGTPCTVSVPSGLSPSGGPDAAFDFANSLSGCSAVSGIYSTAVQANTRVELTQDVASDTQPSVEPGSGGGFTWSASLNRPGSVQTLGVNTLLVGAGAGESGNLSVTVMQTFSTFVVFQASVTVPVSQGESAAEVAAAIASALGADSSVSSLFTVANTADPDEVTLTQKSGSSDTTVVVVSG